MGRRRRGVGVVYVISMRALFGVVSRRRVDGWGSAAVWVNSYMLPPSDLPGFTFAGVVACLATRMDAGTTTTSEKKRERERERD